MGLYALLCLTGGGILVFYPEHEGLQGALLRVGILLFAFWLAMPTSDRPADIQSKNFQTLLLTVPAVC